MRKLISLLLAFSLIFCLGACSTLSEEDINTPEKGYFELNETAELYGLKVTATELKESSGVEFFEPEEGNVFVGVNFTIENVSEEEKSISSLMEFNAYVDGVKCDLSISASCAFDEGTLDGDIAVGKKLIGWYALEVKQDWKEIEIQFAPDLFSDANATFKFTNK